MCFHLSWGCFENVVRCFVVGGEIVVAGGEDVVACAAAGVVGSGEAYRRGLQPHDGDRMQDPFVTFEALQMWDFGAFHKAVQCVRAVEFQISKTGNNELQLEV